MKARIGFAAVAIAMSLGSSIGFADQSAKDLNEALRQAIEETETTQKEYERDLASVSNEEARAQEHVAVSVKTDAKSESK